MSASARSVGMENMRGLGPSVRKPGADAAAMNRPRNPSRRSIIPGSMILASNSGP